MSAGLRLAAGSLAALAAASAAAYLLPPTGILKRVGQRRERLGLRAFEVRGTLAAFGGAARAGSAATGLPLLGAELTVPAVLRVKTPGRCRLELAPPEISDAEHPALVVKVGRVFGWRGLDAFPSAVALVQGVCALLGARPDGAEPDRPWAEALGRAGVPLGDVHLGRFGGRISYVLGAHPSERKPQAWVDKQSFQPVRLMAQIGGALADVRLLDYGSPIGGDWFPRAVEVWEGRELAARFTAEKVAANPRIPDALF